MNHCFIMPVIAVLFLNSDWYMAANVYGRADYFSNGPEYPHLTLG